MTAETQKKIINKSSSRPSESKIRFFFATYLIPLLVFSIGAIPFFLWLLLMFFLYLITLNTILYFIITPIIFTLSIFILIVSEILISGTIIKLFNIKYEEGTYEYSVNNNEVFKWMLILQLYTPIRKILEIIPMRYIKVVYLRLLGMKIGENTLVGGVIRDPCLTEVGNNVTMGDYVIVYCHMHNKAEGTIAIKKIKIGNNCIVGAGAIIMPGVVMEDNAILAAGGVVKKNSVLQKNKIYGGNPAQEIKLFKKKQ
ncbi:MAG: hypothetical protein JSW60_00790 [Thermoplasmatales archaeon]|nr:MAG: hypothetical protein JSW60_00790 [Thermoplasmatales archaeon]